MTANRREHLLAKLKVLDEYLAAEDLNGWLGTDSFHAPPESEKGLDLEASWDRLRQRLIERDLGPRPKLLKEGDRKSQDTTLRKARPADRRPLAAGRFSGGPRTRIPILWRTSARSVLGSKTVPNVVKQVASLRLDRRFYRHFPWSNGHVGIVVWAPAGQESIQIRAYVEANPQRVEDLKPAKVLALSFYASDGVPVWRTTLSPNAPSQSAELDLSPGEIEGMGLSYDFEHSD